MTGHWIGLHDEFASRDPHLTLAWWEGGSLDEDRIVKNMGAVEHMYRPLLIPKDRQVFGAGSSVTTVVPTVALMQLRDTVLAFVLPRDYVDTYHEWRPHVTDWGIRGAFNLYNSHASLHRPACVVLWHGAERVMIAELGK